MFINAPINPYKQSSPSGNDGFIVCGMFTKNYTERCLRLEQSLKKFGLSYVLYEVPSIHSSISPNGIVNSAYMKPKFIREMLNRYAVPILYVDVDCVIDRQPFLIGDIADKGFDFAIFNWISKDNNDAYMPVNLAGYDAHRFWSYSHGIHEFDESQLRCSGGVQFWRNTPPNEKLLKRWEDVITLNPYAADDISLDVAYNNNPEKNLIRSYWLPKSYLRIAFWIFDMPIINHPDIPTTVSKFQPIKLEQGKFWVDRKNIQKKLLNSYIPPNALLDTYKNSIVLLQKGIFLKIGENPWPFYL